MKQLIAKAKEARKKAYAPYSHFKVGAAIEAADGRIFTGCNMENASYGASICAERVAIAKAVSEGARRFTRIAIAADTGEPCPPCGVCRQVLSELAPKIEVIMTGAGGVMQTERLSALFPHPFERRRMEKKK